MGQVIKILPDFQRTVLTPSAHREYGAELTIDYGGDMEVIEVAEELNDVARLKESITFDTDIPYNNINRWLVNTYGNSIPILANAHGLQLPERSMQVNGYTEPGGTFDVSFIRSNDWVESFKTLAINEIDGFEPFQLGETFIENNQLNNAAYPGTGITPTPGYYYPMAYYGGLNRFNQATSHYEITYADYRLWFHYGKILKQCFLAVGWKMDCPFLETDYGQRLAWYLVGGAKVYDGFQSETFKDKLQLPASKHYAFKAENTSDQVLTGSGDSAWFDSERINFQNDNTGENYDNGSSVDGGFWKTSNNAVHGFSGKWKFTGRLKIQGGASSQTSALQFFLNVPFSAQKPIRQAFFDKGGKLISNAAGQLNLSIPGGSVIRVFEFTAEVESLAAFKDIGFGFDSSSGANLTIKAGSTIEGHAEFVVIMLQPTTPGGDTINKTVLFPQSYLSPDIKAIEVLEDYCHRTNSKLYTDRARRLVGIYTENDVPAYGQETESYYFKDIEQDLSGMQVEKSAQVTLKEAVSPGKYILGFKDFSDAYIDSVSKKTPFDAIIDLTGTGVTIDSNKTVENRSNLVEPSIEREFSEVKTADPKKSPPLVLAVLDNMVGEASVNTSPRTAYIYGRVKQKDGSTFREFNKRFSGVTNPSVLVAYATQYPTGEITTFSGGALSNDKTLVYDHTKAVTEPMKRYWIDSVTVLYTRQHRKLNIVVGSFNRFLQLNFRSLFRLKFMGVDWVGRLVSKRTKIDDFNVVEVELREDKVC